MSEEQPQPIINDLTDRDRQQAKLSLLRQRFALAGQQEARLVEQLRQVREAQVSLLGALMALEELEAEAGG